MADIAAKPAPFLPDSGRPAIPWREWHRKFETYLLAAGCEEFTPKRKAALLKTFLGTEADHIANNIESARPAGTSDVDDYKYLVQGLAAHFDGSTSYRAHRIKFRNLRQAETISNRLRAPGPICGSAVQLRLRRGRQQLIGGLASERNRERLLVEGPALTFDRAIQVLQDISEVQDLLQQYRETKEDVQVTEGSQQQRPTRFPRREFRPTRNRSVSPSRSGLSFAKTSSRRSPPPTCGRCGRTWHPLQQCPALGKTCFRCGKSGHFGNVCRTPHSAPVNPPSRPGLRLAHSSARRSPPVCGRCSRMWHPLQQCPALGKTCFQCGKIGHFWNACRTPCSATTHPSSRRMKRHTWSPLRNIEPPTDDERDVVVANQLGQETPTRQGSYSHVKVNDSSLSLFESELAQIIRRESQLAEEMRQLKSQLADLRETLRANSSDFEESTTEYVQEEETDKPEEDSEKADEDDKPQGDAEKVDKQSKPRIQDVENKDESDDKDKKKKKGKRATKTGARQKQCLRAVKCSGLQSVQLI